MSMREDPYRVKLAKCQDWKCYYCRREMRRRTGHADTATIDHKMPLSRGGENKRYNMVACCWRCNNVKGSMSAAEFFAAWGDMTRLPERNIGNLEEPGAALRRFRQKEIERSMTQLGCDKNTKKKLPKTTYAAPACGLVSLGDIADLRRALPFQLRLERAWAELWNHCLKTVDEKTAKC